MSDTIDGPIIEPDPHESIALILLEACQKGIEFRVWYSENAIQVMLHKDGKEPVTYELGAPTLFETAYEHDALLAGVLRRLVDEMHGVKS